MNKKKEYTNYLEGKLVFELGDNYTKMIQVDNVNNQSIDDIKTWAKKELDETSETFKELGYPKLFVRRRYLLKGFNTQWEEVEL